MNFLYSKVFPYFFQNLFYCNQGVGQFEKKYSKILHSIEMTRIFFSYRIQFSFGEVAEWFKANAWKACKPFKGFGGSNPPLSANRF